MRAMLRAAIAACLMLVGAVVADIALAEPRAVAADKGGPVWTWVDDVQAPIAKHNRSAFYVVGLAGLTVADHNIEGFNMADRSWLAGGAIGGNVRFPSSGVVIGLEADYVFTDISADALSIVVSRTKWLASVRARSGLAFGPALLYVTAGPAFTETDIVGPGVDADKLALGGVGGVGIELELTKAAFVRLEALHYIFPDKELSCGASCIFESKNQTTTARVGLGFKF